MQYVLQRYRTASGSLRLHQLVNARNDFVSPLYVGIELGPLIMLIENARSADLGSVRTHDPSRAISSAARAMSGVVDDFECRRKRPPMPSGPQPRRRGRQR
jgi:hypothetical protein